MVDPAYAGFGLEWVNATVPTPHGNLGVVWSVKGSIVWVEIDAPVGTNGTLKLSKDWACANDESRRNKCAYVKDYVRMVNGGRKVQFHVNLKHLENGQ
ncbi:hypothetical protein TCE0_018r04618 [Talaromyces pinophilus]|uniref:Alpha-L-rhamnosidase C-terminal domain-containing protein n=1 Tax=Talaromyces pinophilus TaxID=128442 RepID=A0A510NUK8_TALPI|nr:hypothetical protein TCE0_018r04618 [Talaromyces pinophilus]